MQVITDTSFMMVPGMFGVDVVSELERLLNSKCELLVPSSVAKELRRISKQGKPKEKAAARIGLFLVKRGRIVKAAGRADEAIIRLSVQRKLAVGTTDAALRKELRRLGVSVIFLRQLSHLAVDGQLG